MTLDKNQIDLNEGDINFEHLLNSLFRQKKNIIGIVIASLISTFAYNQIQEPVWEGEFQIVIDKNTNKTKALGLPGNLLSSANGDLQTEIEILESSSVLKPIFDFVKSSKQDKGVNTSGWRYKNWINTWVNIELVNGTSVLNIKYRDENKELILPVLYKISNTYQQYSGRDRERSMTQGINYLEEQLIKYRSKSMKSMKKLQNYSLENSLGTEDGLPNLKINQTLGIDKGFNPSKITNVSRIDIYKANFNKLRELEALLVQKRALLKPESSIIKTLVFQIESLKESVERPKDVLIKYRQLQREAANDESTLGKLEIKLSSLKLERAKQKDPWELISVPTLLEDPISPEKSRNIFLSLFAGFILGSSYGLFIDKRKGIIYELDEFKILLPYPILKTFQYRSSANWEDSIQLLANSVLKDKTLNSIGLVKLSDEQDEYLKKFSELFGKALKDTKCIYSNSLVETSSCAKQIIILSSGVITKKRLSLLKEELDLQDVNVIGCLFFDC